jgi:hypothetical protein
MTARPSHDRQLSGFQLFCVLSQIVAIMCLIEGYIVFGVLGVVGLAWAAIWDGRQSRQFASGTRPSPDEAGDRFPRRPLTPVGRMSASLPLPDVDDASDAA